MRYIRYAFLGSLGIVLLVVALANRGPVTLQLLPGELAELAGLAPSITLPLFIVIFGGIVAGVLIGFVWEWLREHKHRAEAASQRRAREQLEREVSQLRGPEKKAGDDVLALLEGGEAAR
ncbi:MAG: LapA family protein [Rhodobacteraceae bacterium]|nr:LapA family protein [Alphaproteobacteria bacterium]MBT8476668.1 LapA family protein [Alphaproteobacteria bacterium]NNF72593.1 LapA family protein [Paracoccaceae bacterium]NNK66320.1 LapA family protein [Paracoccaceae bacterium]